MKITNSSVAMASTHSETSVNYRETAVMEAAKSDNAVGAILTISREGNGKNVRESMMDYQKMQEEEADKRRKNKEVRSLQNMIDRIRTDRVNFEVPEEDSSAEIKMIRKILAALRGEKYEDDENCKPSKQGNVTDLRSAQYKRAERFSFNFASAEAVSIGAVASPVVGTTGSGTVWQRITASTDFTFESEHTTFATTGLVQTADGRTIDFNVEVSMSREFMKETNLLTAQEYIKTDPLMINLDTNVGSVTDKKYYFDLDSDGKEEQISFAGKDSGFLALDKNGDGKINNGKELFGTKSGDGFKDLAEYDEDGNGWIDENDSIFKRLKVWTKDENGNDRLIDLKKADVGAIYLGNADTQFSLKNSDNRLNAEIKKTGIFLKESTGSVGTLNHVDIAI
ncbi:MAG: hypothetical protein K6A74_07880 [Lachnospiraceae bacterium]|nr:hypothetical protein [Lachnospiraceae bacterium]